MQTTTAVDAAWRTLLGAWALEPSVLAGTAALGGWYVWRRREATGGQRLLFAVGLVTLLLALVSPLDFLADGYLFTAHMTQHLLLAQIVPPLLLLGLSTTTARWLLEWRLLAGVERVLAGHPLVLLAVYSVVLTAWHVPRLYEAALASTPIHVLEHLTMLAAGMAFWWPVIHADLATAEMGPLTRMVYLFLACLPNTALGAILTFAPSPLYATYAATIDPSGLFPLTREAWGLTPLADQQIAGLLMWIPGATIYLGGIAFTFARWFAAEHAAPSTFDGTTAR